MNKSEIDFPREILDRTLNGQTGLVIGLAVSVKQDLELLVRLEAEKAAAAAVSVEDVVGPSEKFPSFGLESGTRSEQVSRLVDPGLPFEAAAATTD